jgi:hypothetical protein
MPYIEFGGKYAPVGLLIVPDGGYYKDPGAKLIQSDWEFPSVASAIGWSPCHDGTDGTVDCKVCGKTAADLIADAYDYLRDHEGESFEQLEQYMT